MPGVGLAASHTLTHMRAPRRRWTCPRPRHCCSRRTLCPSWSQSTRAGWHRRASSLRPRRPAQTHPSSRCLRQRMGGVPVHSRSLAAPVAGRGQHDAAPSTDAGQSQHLVPVHTRQLPSPRLLGTARMTARVGPADPPGVQPPELQPPPLDGLVPVHSRSLRAPGSARQHSARVHPDPGPAQPDTEQRATEAALDGTQQLAVGFQAAGPAPPDAPASSPGARQQAQASGPPRRQLGAAVKLSERPAGPKIKIRLTARVRASMAAAKGARVQPMSPEVCPSAVPHATGHPGQGTEDVALMRSARGTSSGSAAVLRLLKGAGCMQAARRSSPLSGPATQPEEPDAQPDAQPEAAGTQSEPASSVQDSLPGAPDAASEAALGAAEAPDLPAAPRVPPLQRRASVMFNIPEAAEAVEAPVQQRSERLQPQASALQAAEAAGAAGSPAQQPSAALPALPEDAEEQSGYDDVWARLSHQVRGAAPLSLWAGCAAQGGRCMSRGMHWPHRCGMPVHADGA